MKVACLPSFLGTVPTGVVINKDIAGDAFYTAMHIIDKVVYCNTLYCPEGQLNAGPKVCQDGMCTLEACCLPKKTCVNYECAAPLKPIMVHSVVCETGVCTNWDCCYKPLTCNTYTGQAAGRQLLAQAQIIAGNEPECDDSVCCELRKCSSHKCGGNFMLKSLSTGTDTCYRTYMLMQRLDTSSGDYLNEIRENFEDPACDTMS